MRSVAIVVCLVATGVGCFGTHAADDDEGSGGGDVAGEGGTVDEVDPGCLDGCIDKGLSSEECRPICTIDPGGEKAAGASDKSGGESFDDKGGGAGGSGDGDGDVAGDPDPGELDVAAEKDCVGCWYEQEQNGGACAEQTQACEASVACTQLQWCPSLCGKPECQPECDEAIPSGIPLLRALVGCVACDDGPCAAACQGSVALSYCGS